MEVLVGYTNALAQFVLVAWIIFEAITRLQSATPIASGIMLAVASAGLLINLLVLFALGHHDHDDLMPPARACMSSATCSARSAR